MRVAALLILPLLLSATCVAAAPATKPNPVSSITTSDAGKRCVDDCSGDQDRCATTEQMDPGADRKNLCATRFKVCIERCDPHYLNYHNTIDDHPVKGDPAVAAPKMTAGEQCINGCGASARTCSDAGNSAQVCDASRTACMRRCGGPAAK